MTSKPRHLHPLAMLVDSIQLLWMLIVLVFVDLVSDNAARASLINGATRWLVLVILAVVAALALFVVLPYWRTTYELSNQALPSTKAFCAGSTGTSRTRASRRCSIYNGSS
ncbi:hypothetical protein [Lacticaseibacillus thailandensis]|uniref:hypothetical protein n=1 Tax=Lacticaseibacillus thailandensis TaxID=381741 RepID=UPI0006D1CEDB|nr:hypothetical protein [Lacticaseibacillus thailandensis]